ncbi:MAG: hypothetical protein ABI867_09125 [Kofleriaceae bacterium]
MVMKTIALDVMAGCVAPGSEPEPARLAAGTGEHASVFVIHVAPSPRLDPSTPDLDKIEIVSDGELADFTSDVRRFIVSSEDED